MCLGCCSYKSIIDLFVAKDKGTITGEQFNIGFQKKANSERFHGTAIFFIHSDHYYLITAQHVIYDDQPVYFEREEYPDEEETNI